MGGRFIIISGTFLSLLLLSGCGLFRFEQREPWRGEAEVACLRSGHVKESDTIRRRSAVQGAGICGADYPFDVSGLNSGQVVVEPKAVLVCPMIPALEYWMRDVVQPMAHARFGVLVAKLEIMGSYACRGRNGDRRAKISEHAFANAIDIKGFRLADGRFISVRDGWKSADPAEREFLQVTFNDSCRYFATTLGPDGNSFHYDHFHFDLAWHGKSGQRRYCK